MLATYQRKSNIAALLFLGCLIGFVALISQGYWNLRDGGMLGQLMGFAMAISWFYALWAYLKAKGRSGWWLVLGLTGVLGLIVVLFLRDQRPQGQ